jgi:hypothetical protein
MLNNNPYIVGALAGVVSVIALASSASGSLLSLPLSYFLPLPGLIAGIGWGVYAALSAWLSGSVIGMLLFGEIIAISYAVAIGVPVILLSYLCWLNRAEGENTHWYPAGYIIAWTCVFAGIITTIVILLIGTDMDTYQKNLDLFINTGFIGQMPSGMEGTLNTDMIAYLKEIIVKFLPAMLASSWAILMLVNLWLAAKVLHISGRLYMGWPDIRSIEYPQYLVYGFILSLALALFYPGIPGIIANGFAGAFFMAWLLMGLAVIHTITTGHSMRGLFLFATYAGMMLIVHIAVIVAGIGVSEPAIRLRERFSGQKKDRG